jgi:hypothetical protein
MLIVCVQEGLITHMYHKLVWKIDRTWSLSEIAEGTQETATSDASNRSGRMRSGSSGEGIDIYQLMNDAPEA